MAGIVVVCVVAGARNRHWLADDRLLPCRPHHDAHDRRHGWLCAYDPRHASRRACLRGWRTGRPRSGMQVPRPLLRHHHRRRRLLLLHRIHPSRMQGRSRRLWRSRIRDRRHRLPHTHLPWLLRRCAFPRHEQAPAHSTAPQMPSLWTLESSRRMALMQRRQGRLRHKGIVAAMMVARLGMPLHREIAVRMPPHHWESAVKSETVRPRRPALYHRTSTAPSIARPADRCRPHRPHSRLRYHLRYPLPERVRRMPTDPLQRCPQHHSFIRKPRSRRWWWANVCLMCNLGRERLSMRSRSRKNKGRMVANCNWAFFQHLYPAPVHIRMTSCIFTTGYTYRLDAGCPIRRR